MIAGQHPGAGLNTDEADREDSTQVARHLILMRMAEIEYSVILLAQMHSTLFHAAGIY